MQPDRSVLSERGYIVHHCLLELSENSEVRIEKVLALHTSRDHASSEYALDAEDALDRAGHFADLLGRQVLGWKNLWQCFETGFRTGEDGQEGQTDIILHFNLFHVLQTTSMHTIDLDAGVPSPGVALCFNPCVPEEMESLDMGIRYRGHPLRVRVTRQEFAVEAGTCSEESIRTVFKDEIIELGHGRAATLNL